MSTSTCPFCSQILPSSELEWHANNHFVEEDLARDLEVAHQIALTPTSPHRIVDIQIDDSNLFEIVSEGTSKSSSSGYSAVTSYHGGNHISEKISCLVNLQLRSTYYKVEGGLMTLLRRCLELETGNSVSIISGYVDHFQSAEEDAGWGCGWRNIQMLSSHLLMKNLEAKEVLFGGSGFVPDIPSLQRWLEIAWERGFDKFGSNEFDHKIYGLNKWIGTTECATLFRSFGLQAKIVDFGCKKGESYFLSAYGTNHRGKVSRRRGKKKVEQVYGPIDKFLLSGNSAAPLVDGECEHVGIQSGGDSVASTQNISHRSMNRDDQNKCLVGKSKGHQVLTEWVWNYFADNKFNESGNLQHVAVSQKMPLYFQHDGHSRTIVGIQIREQHGIPKQYALLVLDPGHRTGALERCLRENVGWQKLIKRGVHTLKKPQYQLCYIDAGIAQGEEMEQLKTIDSIFNES